MNDSINPVTCNIGELDPWLFTANGHIYGGIKPLNKTTFVGYWPAYVYYEEMLKMCGKVGYITTWKLLKTCKPTESIAKKTLLILPLSLINSWSKTSFCFWVKKLDEVILIISNDISARHPNVNLYGMTSEVKMRKINKYNKVDYITDPINSNIGILGFFSVNMLEVNSRKLLVKSNTFEFPLLQSYRNPDIKKLEDMSLTLPKLNGQIEINCGVGPVLIPVGQYVYGFNSANSNVLIGRYGKGLFIAVSGLYNSGTSDFFLTLLQNISKMYSLDVMTALSDLNELGTPNQKKINYRRVTYLVGENEVDDDAMFIAEGNVMVFNVSGNWWEPAVGRSTTGAFERLGFIAAPENPVITTTSDPISVNSCMDIYTLTGTKVFADKYFPSKVIFIWEILIQWAFEHCKSYRFNNWKSFIKTQNSVELVNKVTNFGDFNIPMTAEVIQYVLYKNLWYYDQSVKDRFISLDTNENVTPRTITWKPTKVYDCPGQINGTGMWLLPGTEHTVTISKTFTTDMRIYASMSWDNLPLEPTTRNLRRDHRNHRREYIIAAGQTSITFKYAHAGVLAFSIREVFNTDGAFKITCTNVCPHAFYSHRCPDAEKPAMYGLLENVRKDSTKYPISMLIESRHHSFVGPSRFLAGLPGDLKLVLPDIEKRVDDIIEDYSWLSGHERTGPAHQFAQSDYAISNGWLHAGYPWASAHDGGALLWDFYYNKSNWGWYHEVGHNHQMGSWDLLPMGTEQSNNIYSMFFSARGDTEKKFEFRHDSGYIRNIPYTWTDAKNNFAKDPLTTMDKNTNGQWWRDFWVALCLEFGWQIFREYQIPYALGTAPVTGGTYEEKTSRMAPALSKIINYNIAPAMRLFGLYISPADLVKCNAFPAWTIPAYFFDTEHPEWKKLKFNKIGRNFSS
ncbi:Peptidase M60-like family [Salmon gill poxvirus]